MRNQLARLAFAVGAIAATGALTAHLLLATALDPERVGHAAGQVASTPEGRAALLDTLNVAATRGTGHALSDQQRAYLDKTLRRPDVIDALEHTTMGRDGTFNYQPLLRAMAVEAKADGRPQVAGMLTRMGQHQLRAPDAVANTYTTTRETASRVRDTAAPIALIALVSGVLVASSRRWALTRAGWILVGTAATSLIIYLLVPKILEGVFGSNLASILITALGAGIVAPLIPVAAVGAGAIVASRALPIR